MKQDLPWFREWEGSHHYFQYEDCYLTHPNGSAQFRRSPRSGATTPGVGWISTLSARANHSLLMASRRLLGWRLRGPWKACDSGGGGTLVFRPLGVPMGEEPTHTGYRTKEMQAQNQPLCP